MDAKKLMDLRTADPDLESLARRLLNSEIDLQPDFQRQEVWNKSKKQKLIDTILRGWAVPPVHLIETRTGEEVLDGQQRLTAIRDFCENRFPVDGNIPPNNSAITALDGKIYNSLPVEVKKKFDRYTLRTYTIRDADPADTSELFYRLNQPTALTSGEQRNALHGPRRTQMKHIVQIMISSEFSSSTIGFSNSRLSYDDVIARSLVLLEGGTLRRKISESAISDAFRIPEKFSDHVFESVLRAVHIVGLAKEDNPLRYNKASLLSIIISLARHQIAESTSTTAALTMLSKSAENFAYSYQNETSHYLDVFHDRSSSRVTDISSVVLRDFCLAKHFSFHGCEPVLTSNEERIINESDEDFSTAKELWNSEVFESKINQSDWGKLI